MLTTSHPAVPAPTTAGESLDALIPAAAAGDRAATASLVTRYTSLIRNVARGYRLTDSDVEDVTQTVWMRCFQHLSGSGNRGRCPVG